MIRAGSLWIGQFKGGNKNGRTDHAAAISTRQNFCLVLTLASGLTTLAGCSSWAGALKGGQTNTVVRLSQKNYRLIHAGARGESSGFWLLCFPIISPTQSQAKDQLYRSIGQPLDGRAIALANQTEDRSLFSLILFSLPKITLTADVVEFVEPGAPPLTQSFTPPVTIR